LLILFKLINHPVKHFVSLSERLPFGRNVAVVETIVVDINLLEEFEKDRNTRDRIIQRVTAIVPWHQSSALSKWITQPIAHAVPICSAEAHVIPHRLAGNHLFRVIVVKGQWVIGIRTLILDLGNVRKIFGHGSFLGIQRKDLPDRRKILAETPFLSL
jgi:hypothetical protein